MASRPPRPDLRHNGAGGRPPSRPTCPPLSVKPLSLAPSSASPLRHSRGLHGNPALECVRLSSPSVILGPCPGIQFLIGKNRTGFPPSVRMTEGEGGRWSFPRLFSFRRHSRGLHGNPVLDRILDSRLLARMTEGEGGDGLNGAGFPPDGWDRTGFPPSVRMTEGEGGRWSFPRLFSFRRHSRALPRESSPRVCCIFLRRHSRGLHGNPVLDRILDSRLLARMTEGGCHGNPVMKPAA